MAKALNIGSTNLSAKVTVAELGGVVVMMPIAKSYTKGPKVNSAGIPIPSPWTATSLAGTGITGTFYYAIAYKDSVRGRESAPTSVRSVVATNNTVYVKFGSLTNTTANTTVDKIVIYRTLDGGQVLFKVAETSIAATSYADNNTDATISANDTAKVDRQALRAPTANTYGLVRRHGRRVFYGGPAKYYGADTSTSATRYTDYGNRMAFSPLEYADALPTDNAVIVGDETPIRAFDGMGDFIAIYKERSIHIWSYREGVNGGPDGNTGNGSIDNMELGRGAVTFKSQINVDGAHFVMDYDGWYVYRGGQALTNLDEAIRPLLLRVNWNVVHAICGAYDDRRIVWFLPLDGDTECKHALVLDRKAYETGRGAIWWLYRIPHGVADCTQFVMGPAATNVSMGMAGRRFIKILTTAGYEFIFDDVLRDGVHPEITATGVLASASSLVFTATGADFDVASATLTGCFVQFDHSRTPSPLRIGSSASNQFTLSTSLGFTLPASTAFTIGGIEAYWRSGHIDAGDPHETKLGYDFNMVMRPLGVNPAVGLGVRLMGDRLSPRINMDSTTQTGYRLVGYADHVLVDLGGKYTSNNRTGIVQVPLQAREFATLQVELFSNTVDCPWKVSSFAMHQLSRKKDK